jgi:hypothetical protein
MFVQATAEPILSSTKPMEKNRWWRQGVFNFPDAHFSTWKGMVCVFVFGAAFLRST